MAGAIPFGQPILVCHHSEKRDRNYRAKIENTFGKSFKLMDKAKHYENKAAGVGTGGISSDDPEAIDKLKQQLLTCEAAQEKFKAVNKIIRKHKTAEKILPALIEYGLKELEAQKLLIPDYMGRTGFAPFELSNNNANMKRIKDRIKVLESKKKLVTQEILGKGFVCRQDVEENRIMFIFDDKPDEPTRKILKSNAFKWSPNRGAWVRQMTGNAVYSARRAIKEINGEA